MLLEAFHLVAILHHSYVFWCLSSVEYKGVSNTYLFVMRDLSLRFLTVWNLILQMTYFCTCTCQSIMRKSGTGKKVAVLINWNKLREMVFRALLFPVACLVTVVFWVLFLYDRNLVYPEIVDIYVPPHVNHMMHTNISVMVLLELVMRPHYYSHRGRDLTLLLLWSTLYLFLYTWTYYTRGVWMYPLYNHLSWTGKILMDVLVAYILPPILYCLGEVLVTATRGKKVHQINGEKCK